ncbi:unnamed protein product [Malus baccata var. baccata]
MAEGVLFNVAARIIGRLGSLAFQEIGLIWGVQDELHKLQEIVAGFQGVLLDAEQKQTSNEVKLWLQSVEDAVYEADDLLDEFNTEAQQRQMMCGNTKISNQLAFGLKMGHKIKDINKRLREVASRRAFPLEVNCEDTRFIIRERITHSFVPKENIIGRDEDKKSIIQLLLDPISTENVSTISIVGFGGLGKTALAQLIFNDEVIQNHFELKIWSCVSNVFEVDILVKKILKVDKIDMDELQNDLRRKVDGKKYLIVLDDVWNENREKWLSLKYLLLGGGKGCYRLTRMPRGLGELNGLRTLNTFVLSENNSLLRDSAAGLGELGRLKELRGELEIKNLRHEKDVMSESNEKQHLHSLYLGWKRGEDVNAIDEKDVIMSMEVLQPHSNLKMLSVWYYGGVRFASWFSSLINLVDLRLWGCHRCQHLPPLDHFPSLKFLELGGFEKLEYISDNTSSSNSTSDEMMTSLESLWVESCPVLKGWWRAHTHNNASSSSSTENLSLPSFPSLSQLTIRKCPNLTSMPLYPNVEGIELNGCSLKVVDSLFVRGASDITHDVGVDVSASSSPHLFKLTRLLLINIEDLECLTSQGMGNVPSLQSLQSLYIADCPNLALLPYHGTGNLSSLRELTVRNCSNLTSMSEGIANLTSLQKLTIGKYSDLTLPPEVVINLPSLQSLMIASFPNLVSLPEEISNLTSLQHLAIQRCSNLASLPEGIRQLPNLNRLQIWSCPMLRERCKEETGEDWPKMAHIPSISIY